MAAFRLASINWYMFHGACASRVYKRETFLRHKFLPKAAALFDPEHGGGEGAWQGAAGAAALLLRAAHPSSAYCAQNMPPPWGREISGMKVHYLVCNLEMSSKVADQCYCTILYNILYIQYIVQYIVQYCTIYCTFSISIGIRILLLICLDPDSVP